MNKTFLLSLGVLILLLVGGFIYLNKSTNKSEVTMQNPSSTIIASPEIKKEFITKFAVYTNNTFRDFSASKYHNLSPDVYIDPSDVNIIHVKNAGVTWADFFRTLPMELKKDCLVTGTKQTFCNNNTSSLKFYINSKNIPDALDLEIKEGDKLLVSFGPINDPNLEGQIQDLDN